MYVVRLRYAAHYDITCSNESSLFFGGRNIQFADNQSVMFPIYSLYNKACRRLGSGYLLAVLTGFSTAGKIRILRLLLSFILYVTVLLYCEM